MTKSEAIKILSDDIEMAIKALESQPKWIPCSERLPKKDGGYLVSMDGMFGKDIVDIVIWNHNESENNGFVHPPLEVIAWMPLPEPYKAESEDKE